MPRPQVDPLQPVFVHMLPLSLGLILCATAIPVELVPAAPPSIRVRPFDFVANIALYVPLGLALRRRPARDGAVGTGGDVRSALCAALGAGAVLSTAIEILQIWFVGRQPSIPDVAANSLGAVAGAALAGLLRGGVASADPYTGTRAGHPGRGKSLPFVLVGGWIALAAAGAAIAIGTAMLWRSHQADLSNWDPSYELLLGNEVTADRPWRGRLSAVALVPEAISHDDARALAAAGDRLTAGPPVPRARWLVRTTVHLDGDALRVTDRLDARLFRATVERNAFTVVLRGATADLEQRGPARLITFSRDQFQRNFDVGQEGRAVRFRVRTPAAGLNGDIYAETGDVLEADRLATIVASYDGDSARIYVDGRLAARANLAAATCLTPSACDADAPLAAGLLGGCLALGALPLLGRRRGGLIGMVLLVTSVAGVLAYAGAAGTVPAFQHWFAPTAGAGAVAVAIAAWWGRTRE